MDFPKINNNLEDACANISKLNEKLEEHNRKNLDTRKKTLVIEDDYEKDSEDNNDLEDNEDKDVYKATKLAILKVLEKHILHGDSKEERNKVLVKVEHEMDGLIENLFQDLKSYVNAVKSELNLDKNTQSMN